MYPYDENENRNENVPGEENAAEENVNENAANLNDGAAEASAGCDNAAEEPDGSYRMVKPDAGKSFDAKQRPCYRDANYTSEGAANFYSPSNGRKEKEAKPKKVRRGMPAAAVVALCLVCALVGGGAGGVIAQSFAGEASPAPTTSLTQEPAPTASGSTVSSEAGGMMSASDIYYNLALKQVVGINTEIVTTNLWGMPVQGSVSGSGFVISEDGYILTNYHVIEDAYAGGYDINVMFSDESGYDTTEYTAEVIGFDRNNDVAVIKIDASGLSAATLGSSDDLRVGDTVYAVGNPLGELNYSMSEGMVSATDRLITTEEGTANMFQLTAAVNEGNSGGPVYNAYGQVVGIVTARPSEEGAQGIGFAVPIDDAVHIADRYVSGDNQLDPDAEPAWLGVQAQSVDRTAMQYYNMPAGAYVTRVVEGSPAESAGILVGDIITSVSGYDVQSRDELAEELSFHAAGEEGTITVYRSGEYLDISVTFGSDPENETGTVPDDIPRIPG